MDDQALIAKLLARLDEVEERLRHVEAYRASLVHEVQWLREENTILKDKVRELTARINEDSSNSSKPPSSDKPWKDRRPSKPTGKSRGAQPGHEGKTRDAFPPEQVDLRVPVVPDKCSKCARGLDEKHLTGKTLPHQVVEIGARGVPSGTSRAGRRSSACAGCQRGGCRVGAGPDHVVCATVTATRARRVIVFSPGETVIAA